MSKYTSISKNIKTRQRKVRLFLDYDFVKQQIIKVSPNQAHYLKNVMRLVVGDSILIFNGKDGEWEAVITTIGSRGISLTVKNITRQQVLSRDCWLLFPPIKARRTDFLVEKATELGISRLIPIRTTFCEPKRFNHVKQRANAIEASEQCLRLDIPSLSPLTSIDKVLNDWSPSRLILFCDEKGVQPMEVIAQKVLSSQSSFAILIGPEGGFSEEERNKIKNNTFVHPVSLGRNILRTETAALAALCIALTSKELKYGD